MFQTMFPKATNFTYILSSPSIFITQRHPNRIGLHFPAPFPATILAENHQQSLLTINQTSKTKNQIKTKLSMEASKHEISPSPFPTKDVPSSTIVTSVPSEPTHIFKSKLPSIPISNHLSLYTYCFENISSFANNPCLISSNKGITFTFSKTRLLSLKTAAGLTNLGIKKGDTIMILLQNCPEFVFSFIGASMIGAVSTTANPLYTPQEIFKQLKSSRAKLVITQSIYIDKLNIDGMLKICKDFIVITIDDPPENCLHFSVLTEADENGVDLTAVEIYSEDPVALPFSSGTTGLPKGVILTHKSLITSVAQQVDGDNPNLYLTPNDVVLCVLPMFHIFSLSSVLLCSLRAGAGILLLQNFAIGTLLELIKRYRVSVAVVVPPLVLALTKSPMVAEFDLSSIRLVLSGAAPLGKELEYALRRRIPQAILGQGYGMTETGPVISMCLGFAKQPFAAKSGSCGTVVRNAELKVVDPQTGCSLGYNQIGEICIRGEQIMKGYLNDPEATANTIDVEGWLHTGDIGYVDDDEELFIIDRLKEIIKYKCFQVSPAEIEGLLVSHPFIEDAAVVPQKDQVAGEVPVAFVVRSNGIEPTEEAVKKFIAKQVVAYKKIHRVYFVQAIPRSPSGKILRKDLQAKLAAVSPVS